jgi:hypothetical protein
MNDIPFPAEGGDPVFVEKMNGYYAEVFFGIAEFNGHGGFHAVMLTQGAEDLLPGGEALFYKYLADSKGRPLLEQQGLLKLFGRDYAFSDQSFSE